MRIRDKLVQYQDNINLKRAKVMIKQIKETRIKIDGLYQLTKELKPIYVPGQRLTNTIHDGRVYPKPFGVSLINSKEIEESAKSLLLAKSWLGKLLGELGSDNLYSSGKKEVKDIEPAADTHNKVSWDMDVPNQETEDINPWLKWNHIEKVDWLRCEIQKIIDVKDEMSFVLPPIGRTYYLWTFKYLCEAKMWLGFEFSRIREENEKE